MRGPGWFAGVIRVGRAMHEVGAMKPEGGPHMERAILFAGAEEEGRATPSAGAIRSQRANVLAGAN
jgi:hypothetical protein